MAPVPYTEDVMVLLSMGFVTHLLNTKSGDTFALEGKGWSLRLKEGNGDCLQGLSEALGEGPHAQPDS